ncbi:endonuclease/exonuclease/phosphatase family protein [Motilimonas sp. E26]|nr:endonuclease/exonuclease/phosphatase family protein [Motilimonas sp. E26]
MKIMLKNIDGHLKKIILLIIILLTSYTFFALTNFYNASSGGVYSLTYSRFYSSVSCPQWQTLPLSNISFAREALPSRFKLIVWNIYKYQAPQWQATLDKLSKNADLLLLQEAKGNKEINQYWLTRGWYGELANAFQIGDSTFGVQTLAKVMAQKVCVNLTAEPYIRFPKSTLAVTYPWQGSDLPLLVINIHGINFTLGTETLKAQLSPLLRAVDAHKGPVIVAGDLNTWSQDRIDLVERSFIALGLRSVNLEPDHRLRVMGMPLDHVYFRGLNVERAFSSLDPGSDHQPLIMMFSPL